MISQEKAMSHRSSGGRADGGEPAGGSGSAIIETALLRTQQMTNACHIHQKCWQLQRTSAAGEGRSPEEAVASTRGSPATLPCLLRIITTGTSSQAVMTQMCTHVTAVPGAAAHQSHHHAPQLAALQPLLKKKAVTTRLLQ